MKGFMTLKEASEKLGISERRINTICLQGRIDGASKIGNMWVVPDNMKIPADRRIKTGRYVGIKRKKDT